MKKSQNTITAVKKEKALGKRTHKRSVATGHHRRVVLETSESKYSDGLIRVYKQEEEDINRFAAFAKTLMSR